ncbi:hypothetical protein B0J11DRAFT_513016 [Dendryphion nanum]|uniref:Uncharacterized protein n=1 Tax=Dendryphion nanum TaxID=256645 RepID=A0A9P9CYC4_9PLEO|nr:hypothetical protein B0J11DRAFT_513016 [Dendryphion nanum]
MPPHSKTVRGTLDNPKTKAAIEKDQKPPQIGDPVSKISEKDDSAPSSSVPDSSNTDANQRQKSELPHSQTVRGTLANSHKSHVDQSKLGDPVSLKVETSKSDKNLGARSSNGDETTKTAGGKSKL